MLSRMRPTTPVLAALLLSACYGSALTPLDPVDGGPDAVRPAVAVSAWRPLPVSLPDLAQASDLGPAACEGEQDCPSGFSCLTDGCGLPRACFPGGHGQCGGEGQPCCDLSGQPQVPPGPWRCAPGLACVSGGCLRC